jgi:FkbM family methyltransferase
VINHFKYYKTFLRYGTSYEGDAWFANNYIYPFKKKGLYIDLGCYHPLKYSQTYKLYKFGWRGINLDISKESIDLFNIFRPHDKNLNLGVSTKSETRNAYFEKKISTLSSLNKDQLKISNRENKIIRKVETTSIKELFEKNGILEVDFLKIDCEGMDLDILKTLNFDKYKINFLSVEFIYSSGDFINKKNNNIESVHHQFLSSEIFSLLQKNFKLIDHFGFAFLLANKNIY